MSARQQLALPWPGIDAPCPKCQGRGEIYYLNARRRLDVDVVGGKRIVCPVCQGTRVVRLPTRAAPSR